MPDTDPSIRDEILKQLKFLRIVTVAVGIAILLLFGYTVIRLASINTALCTFRTDLESRAAGAQDFLDHPEKYPGIKISPSIIEQQLKGQEQTIKSLESLHC